MLQLGCWRTLVSLSPCLCLLPLPSSLKTASGSVLKLLNNQHGSVPLTRLHSLSRDRRPLGGEFEGGARAGELWARTPYCGELLSGALGTPQSAPPTLPPEVTSCFKSLHRASVTEDMCKWPWCYKLGSQILQLTWKCVLGNRTLR